MPRDGNDYLLGTSDSTEKWGIAFVIEREIMNIIIGKDTHFIGSISVEEILGLRDWINEQLARKDISKCLH
jgi:hypothetical protein